MDDSMSVPCLCRSRNNRRKSQSSRCSLLSSMKRLSVSRNMLYTWRGCGVEGRERREWRRGDIKKGREGVEEGREWEVQMYD